MTSFNSSCLFKDPSPNAMTLGVTASTSGFWEGHSSVHSIRDLPFSTCVTLSFGGKMATSSSRRTSYLFIYKRRRAFLPVSVALTKVSGFQLIGPD